VVGSRGSLHARAAALRHSRMHFAIAVCRASDAGNDGSVLALAYVWETRCLLVGGDFNALTYDPAHGYKMAPKSANSGSNLRRLCRVPAQGSATGSRNSTGEIDMSSRLVWEDVMGPEEMTDSDAAQGARGARAAISDPVKVLLPSSLASERHGCDTCT
jgi:hypothetical protein